VPPYTFSDWTWQISGQGVDPDNSIQVFDQGSPMNFFRRSGPDYGACPACFSVTCKITDARGCQLLWGNTVDVDDLRCVNGQDGFFEVMQPGPGTIQIFNIQPAGYAAYDVSFDGFNTIVASGVTADPFVIGGLSPGTYAVWLRLKCNPIVDGIYGYVGPIEITI
jgi:hypothetical protein